MSRTRFEGGATNVRVDAIEIVPARRPAFLVQMTEKIGRSALSLGKNRGRVNRQRSELLYSCADLYLDSDLFGLIYSVHLTLAWLVRLCYSRCCVTASGGILLI